MPSVYSVWRQICHGWRCMRENRAVLSSHPHDDCVTGTLRTSNRGINLLRPNCTVHWKSTRNKVVTFYSCPCRTSALGVEIVSASHPLLAVSQQQPCVCGLVKWSYFYSYNPISQITHLLRVSIDGKNCTFSHLFFFNQMIFWAVNRQHWT